MYKFLCVAAIMFSFMISCQTGGNDKTFLNSRDTAGISGLLFKADTLNPPDSALVIANEALQLSRNLPDTYWQGRSFMSIAEAYRQEGMKAAIDSNARNIARQHATEAVNKAIPVFIAGGFNEYAGDAYLLRSKLMEISDPSVSPTAEQFESKEMDEQIAWLLPKSR